MFSKTELKFLKEEIQVSEGHARVLKYRINKKVKALKKVIPLLRKKGYDIPYIMENSNGVTEFSNKRHYKSDFENFQKKPILDLISENNWCGGWDSNPRSPEARDLESCAFSLPAGIDLALPPPPPPLHFPCLI